MEEIDIIETETVMSDGSISVHCEAVHDGQKIAACYSAYDPEHREIRRRAAHLAIRTAIWDLISLRAPAVAALNVLGTPSGDHEHWIASGEIPGIPQSADDYVESPIPFTEPAPHKPIGELEGGTTNASPVIVAAPGNHTE